ncbi:MAG: DUF937 domain-containing protein [Gemmatimonadales bacterium]|jgi:hypothetical protein|nr:DUF937 domain-containing protein [Gemmatimonadales bacterium]
MSGSLFDLAKQYLTPDVIDKLAALTGEAPAAATKGMGAAVPSVLAGMLQQASTPDGLGTLMNLFNQGKYDGGMLGNLAGAFSGGSADSLLKVGGPIVASLFGNRSNGITDLLASVAGVKRSTASTMLSLGAPFLMNIIGKQLSSRGGLSANSLKDLLFSQRGSLAAAAPAGLAQALGIADFNRLGADVREAVREPVREEESPLKKLLPWLIGLLGLLLLFSFLRGCGKDGSTAMPVDTLKVEGAPAPVGPAPSTTDTVSAAPGTTIQGPAYNQQGGGAATGTGTSGAVTPSTAAPSTGAPAKATGAPPAGAMGGDGPAGKDTAFPGMQGGAGNQAGGVGAMGGRGASGKEVPTGKAPVPQAQQKP